MADAIDLTLSDDEDEPTAPIQSFPVKQESTPLNTTNNLSVVATSSPPTSNFLSNGELKRTRVDGKGMWVSWTRNFRTPTLALLDLIDNCLDASIQAPGEADNFIGRVHIQPDIYRQDEKPREVTTGITIVNNSWKPIRQLAQVLEVYNSSKLDVASGDIGENGIGLKQGCAAISDLSFILVKSGSDSKCELGIVAGELQRADSVYLPAFQFSNSADSPTSLKQQMMALFSQRQHQDVAECVAKYGAAMHGRDPSLASGIDRLCQQFDKICKDFYNDPYVFCLILDKPRDNVEGRVGGAADALTKIRVNKLLKSLRQDVVSTYLHIPDSFDFRVGDENSIKFHYWQSRLVEMSAVTVNVCKTIDLFQNIESEHEHPDSYNLKVYFGFDKERITDPVARKAASLYIYSRQSGRLVKQELDARHLLKLTAGGSHFCSALTILVDDSESHLPLSPTKQDIAFGEDVNGETHSENLYQMIGAATKFYYQHHLSKFNGKKELLTAHISHFADDEEDHQFKSFDESEFTTYSLMFKKHGNNSIRVDKKHLAETSGCDTIWHLAEIKGPKSSPRSRSKRRKQTTSDDAFPKPDELRTSFLPEKSPSGRKRSRPSRSKDYYYDNDDFDSDDNDEGNDESEEEEYEEKRSTPSKRSSPRKPKSTISVNDACDTSEVISLCNSSDEEDENSTRVNAVQQKTIIKEENSEGSASQADVSRVRLENDEVKKENVVLRKENETLITSLSAKVRRIESLEKENHNLKKVLEQLRKK